jgi:hypothetical protein
VTACAVANECIGLANCPHRTATCCVSVHLMNSVLRKKVFYLSLPSFVFTALGSYAYAYMSSPASMKRSFRSSKTW